MPRGGRVEVRGATALYRSFKAISDDLTSELVEGLEEAAEPVKTTATQLALTRIRNMPRSPDWAEMRIGVSRREALVYMVPFSRGKGRGRGARKRPNLADLLSQRSMDPALEQNEERVTEKVEDLLDHLSRKHDF
jgi:hypothetical protein